MTCAGGDGLARFNARYRGETDRTRGRTGPRGTRSRSGTAGPGGAAADAVVVIDEAYGEFRRPGVPSALELLAERADGGEGSGPRYPHLAVTRTMSKAFGAAGLRLGYLAASRELVDALRIVRLPYHLSALTQAAALAALSHREELMSQVASLRAERDALVAWLRERGLTAHDSDANFVLFGPFEDRDVVWRSLLERGILIRVVGPEGYLRVSIGTPEEMDAFRTALAGVLTADANEGAGRSSRNSKQDNEEKSA